MTVEERFVIHLPVVAGDLVSAVVVAGWASLLAQADAGETIVSAEDDQGVRHRVFCDLLMPGGRHCLLWADHDGPCARRLTR